jgi:ABC-type lipoprotein release transport system permease subunit
MIEYTPELESILSAEPNCEAVLPRIESFALASTGSLTKGVLVMGIDPEKEDFLSKVRSKLISADSIPGNSYLATGDKGALIGKRLADYLKLNPGDTLVLIGQGYHGTTAAGQFRIAGIVEVPSPDIDNRIVYLSYQAAQEFYSAPGMVTSLALAVKENDDESIAEMMESLGVKIGSPLKILGWRTMNELMINQMDADSKSGMVMIGILYLVIAFGVFGTVLMMTVERKREFGVLIAVGMQKSRLAIITSIELILIGAIGILSGIVMSLPVIYYGYYNPVRFTGEMAVMYEQYGMEPVMPFLLPDTYMIWQSVVVSIIILITIIYPIRKIYRMEIVNSLKA